eukprot:3768261-Pyramimonas_sp.AAC.1
MGRSDGEGCQAAECCTYDEGHEHQSFDLSGRLAGPEGAALSPGDAHCGDAPSNLARDALACWE